MAAAICLSSSNLHTGPRPVGTRARSAYNCSVITTGAHGTGSSDILNSQASDGDAGSRVTVEISAVIILFDENSVPVTLLIRYVQKIIC